MNFLKALFPGADAANKVIDATVSGIDKLFYTDEEKADDKAKAKQQAAAMYIRWMEATSGQNRARRAIALTVTALWAATFLFALCLDVAAPWVPAGSQEALRQSTAALRSGANDMSGPFMIVLGFYFGQRMLDAFKGGKPS